jgi:hypothetical protein
METRTRILAEYLSALRDVHIDYCVIRGHENIISNPEKDIDLMMMPMDFIKASQLFSEILKKYRATEICNFVKWKNLYLKAAIASGNDQEISTIYFHAVAYTIIKTKKWQVGKPGLGRRLWINDIDIVQTTVNGIDIFVPSPKFQLILLQARYLQYPKRDYLFRIRTLLNDSPEKNPSVADLLSQEILDEKHIDLDRMQTAISESLKCALLSLHGSSIFKRLYYLISMLWVNLRTLGQKRGFLVFFSGPDGSGKTTANALLSEFLKNKLNVHVINVKHLYPSSLLLSRQSRKLQAKIRGVSEKDVMVLERDRGSSKSWHYRRLLGLLFLLTQILPGYLWARYKNQQGYFVIVDTSFFDMFVKGHRPEFPMLEKFITPFIPAGDYWFVMKADAMSIANRKRELSIEEINYYYRRLEKLTERSQKNPTYIRSDKGFYYSLYQLLFSDGK